jgi:DNA-binding GntR family transcriptional regulator
MLGTTVTADSRKLAGKAYEILLGRILAHEMPGGTVIQERKLALALGISRTPLRDAVGRLESEGLLTRLTDRLVAVRVITLEDYLNSLDVRALIEPPAAALAVRAISAAELDGLETLLDELKRRDDATEDLHWAFDEKLHGLIAEKSGNPFLARTIKAMRRYTQIFERQMQPPRDKPGIDDHRGVLAALRAGKPDKVREAMADHIRNVRKRALDGL